MECFFLKVDFICRALCGIRTHDLSRRAAADLRLGPPGHWDRKQKCLTQKVTFLREIYNFIRELMGAQKQLICCEETAVELKLSADGVN